MLVDSSTTSLLLSSYSHLLLLFWMVILTSSPPSHSQICFDFMKSSLSCSTCRYSPDPVFLSFRNYRLYTSPSPTSPNLSKLNWLRTVHSFSRII